MRYWYGASLSDWTFEKTPEALAKLVGGVALTFWNAEVDGEQYTDLLDAAGAAVSTISSSDGSDGRDAGTVPPFRGPDDIASMWAAGPGGKRLLIHGQLGDQVKAAAAQAAAVSASLSAHIAAANPHATDLGDLGDVAAPTPLDGQILAWDNTAKVWKPVAVPGLSGVADLASAQTITGWKTFDNPNDTGTRVTLRAAEGQVGDLLVAWSSASSGEGGQRQRTTYLNEKGEFRVIAAKGNSVAVRIKGQPTQSVHVLEQTDTANNPVAWWEPDGRWRAPNIGITPTWNQDTGAVGTGTYRIYNPMGVALTLRGFIVSAGGTPPAGGDYIINPKMNGAAVYASGNRPRITAGNRDSGLVTNLATTTWPAGSYLTVDVDAVPSTAPTKVTITAVAY